MIYPAIQDLAQGEYNRYEIALATAKCARMITNEYVQQRETAERSMTGNKETDKPLNTMIDREVRDEKAVKIALSRIQNGEYTIVHKDPAEQAREEEAFLNRNKDLELDRYALLYERHNEDEDDADEGEDDEPVEESESLEDEE
jgi:DNA-directed RNA polymerase subunit K/omega